MKKFILLSILLVACQTNQTRSIITPVEVALVIMNDGVTTPPSDAFGCGDTIQLVEQNMNSSNPAEKIGDALEALFAIEDSLYGESGLYNSLAPSDVVVDSVTIDGTSIEVILSGSMISAGSCDDPRLEEQIRATVEANAPEEATITICGHS